MIPEKIGYITIFISLAGDFFYIKDTLLGHTKPNRITWFMWTLNPFIATAAQIVHGVGLSVLPVFLAGFGPLLVLLASFLNKKAYWKLTKMDYVYGALSLLALILWAITKNPAVAVIFAIISEGLASIPTVIKSWKHPETETGMLYILALVNQVIGLLIIRNWNFVSYSFGLYLLALYLIILLGIYRRKFFHPLFLYKRS